MFGLIGTVAGWAGTFLFRFVGGHLLRNHLLGLGVGTLQILVEGLGFRGIAGFALGLYFTSSGFRAGIDAAIKSLF